MEVKEFIQLVKEKSKRATTYDFEDQNHVLYPWRNSSSPTKTMVKEIYNLIMVRQDNVLDALVELSEDDSPKEPKVSLSESGNDKLALEGDPELEQDVVLTEEAQKVIRETIDKQPDLEQNVTTDKLQTDEEQIKKEIDKDYG